MIGPSSRRLGPVLAAAAAGSGRIAQAGCTIVTIPLVSARLNAEEFGVWIAITGLMAFANVIDLGIGAGLVNRLTAAARTGDTVDARRCISTAYALLLGVGAAITLGGLAAVALLPVGRLLNLDDAAAGREAAAALAVTTVCLGLLAPIGVVARLRLAFHENHIHNAADVVAAVLIALFIVAASRLGGGVVAMTLAVTAPPVLVNVVNTALFFARGRAAIAPAPRCADMGLARRFVRHGLLFFVITLATIVSLNADAIIALRVLGAEAAAQCGVAVKLITSLQAVIGMMFLPFWPLYAAPLGDGQVAEVWAILGRSLALALAVSLPVALVLALFGTDILGLWLGRGVAVPPGIMLASACWLPLFAVGAGVNACAFNTPFVAALSRIMAVGAIVIITTKVLFGGQFGPAGIIWGGVVAFPVAVLAPTLLAISRRLRRIGAVALTPAPRGAE